MVGITLEGALLTIGVFMSPLVLSKGIGFRLGGADCTLTLGSIGLNCVSLAEESGGGGGGGGRSTEPMSSAITCGGMVITGGWGQHTADTSGSVFITAPLLEGGEAGASASSEEASLVPQT